MPVLTIPGSTARVCSEVKYKCYILENIPLETLLFNRNLMGVDFKSACQHSAQYYLQHFAPELGVSDDVAELMLLSKGLYYWFHNAYGEVFGRNLPINLLATRRAAVEGSSARVEIPYANLDAGSNRLLIGDTVASGATVCSALLYYMEHFKLTEVFLFSIVASVVGIERIARFCAAHGIQVHIGVGLGLFGLGANGFDLAFLHPETITADRYKRRARAAYRGLPISVAGWDFGCQAQAPVKYKQLCWVEQQVWGLNDGEIFDETLPPDSLNLISKERDAYRLLPGLPKNENGG